MTTDPTENPEESTMPGRNGGTLRRGGTNKGGTGRPRKAFKEACAAIVSDGDWQENLRRKSLTSAAWAKLVIDHGVGLPDQTIRIDPAAGSSLDELFRRLAPKKEPWQDGE